MDSVDEEPLLNSSRPVTARIGESSVERERSEATHAASDAVVHPQQRCILRLTAVESERGFAGNG